MCIRDSPNGRPPLEKVGVYMTDRDTVNKTERMKVTTCLNPLHTAMSVYGCMPVSYTHLCRKAAACREARRGPLVSRRFGREDLHGACLLYTSRCV